MSNKYENFKDIILDNKSPERVSEHYLKYPSDWKAQYNMLLPDKDNCGKCIHSNRCKTIFGGNDENTSCQFYPSKYFKINP